jgi:hypothetical protein
MMTSIKANHCRRAVFVAAAALLVLGGACAGPGGMSDADVTGDERGGKVSYAEGKVSAAMNATQAHCAKFGKKAQITQMMPGSQGGQIGFECR